MNLPKSILGFVPYVGSVCLAIPYLFFFERNPMRWIQAEYAVVFGVILSYLFWLGSLGYTLRRPHLEFNRIIARYLLLGQLIAFTVPLLATLAVFMFKISIPLNFSAPFVLLFPIALFLGIILGRLRQSQMQLIQAEKMATLGNLFAGLTHEINNPLTFVYSNLEPLRESLHHLKEKILSSPNPPDEETQRVLNDLDPLVDTMEEGATRAKKIIETFRSMSRSGESEVSEVDLNFLTQQSLNLLSPKWKNRIQIETHFSALPLLRLSPTEIGQVLMNVLSNAFESIPQRGVVTVTTRGSQKWVEVCVKDSGEGIPKSSLSKIFDPFYTTKPQGQGTGLGLAIVFQKVKKCGGTIEVKSEVGRGTEVVVRLPCKTL